MLKLIKAEVGSLFQKHVFKYYRICLYISAAINESDALTQTVLEKPESVAVMKICFPGAVWREGMGFFASWILS